MDIKKEYEVAKEIYKKYNVDTDEVIKIMNEVNLSIHCWQGDDVKGFLFNNDLSGGIQVTGNYKGRARNIEELRKDLELVFSLVPGNNKLNLHAIYADTKDKIDLDELEPKHFKSWVQWAKKNNIGLDFNPTLFSHKNADSGFTLSSYDENIRNFWIEHCKRSRKIGEYFGKELNQKSVVNIWIPDGYKDNPISRIKHREYLKDSLDKIFEEKLDDNYILDTLESKLFGIGQEAYTTGSHEFYLAYAIKNNKAICLDAGHFHPTENISDKISSILLFSKEILLHLSRPMRWDSDHVILNDDNLNDIFKAIVRDNLLNKVHLGLDFFDASINRTYAWVIGIKNAQKALIHALLEPRDFLLKLEEKNDYSDRLFYTEELKSLPYGIIYDYYCYLNNKPYGDNCIDVLKNYEENVLDKR